MLGTELFDDVLNDVLKDLLEEDTLSTRLSEGDYLQDQTPSIGTDHVAGQILALALASGPRVVRPKIAKTTRGWTAFGVGRRGGQAEPTRQVSSRPDVGFTGPDGVRVNLEVDPRGSGIHTHRDDHIRAMQAAVQNNHSPNEARSVFVGVRDGRIHEVRHVHYERGPGGQVVPVEDAHVRLERPLTPQQAWARGILQAPPGKLRQDWVRRLQQAPSASTQPPARTRTAAGRTSARHSPAPRGTRRGQRFDMFEDASDLY